MYATLEEAEFRLQGTYVVYDGQLMYCHRVENHADGVMRLRLMTPAQANGDEARDEIRRKINSPKFRRFQTPELGYANYFHGGSTNVSWVERLPVRRSKQGLDGTNVQITDTVTGTRHNLGRFFASDAAAEMIAGTYPTFADAVPRLIAGSSIAVDRFFAVSCDETGFIFLSYKKQRIGLVFNGRVYLSAARQHMRETIIECPNLPDVVEIA